MQYWLTKVESITDLYLFSLVIIHFPEILISTFLSFFYYNHLFKSVPIWIYYSHEFSISTCEYFGAFFGWTMWKKCELYKYRQWHWSILGNITSQAGADEVLKKPNLPPRGVPNPNGAQSRFTARLSDLYGTSNSSGHLWIKRRNNTRGKTKIIFKMFKWSKNDLINKKTQNKNLP